MKKVLVFLAVICAAVSSCKPSPAEYEKDFTGSWLLTGSADLKWQSIENLRNYKVAEAIDNRLSPEESNTVLDFGNRKIAFTINGEWGGSGSYVINNDGIVTVSWNSGEKDVYWMYAKDNNLYLIEYSIDQFGDVSGVQTAFKFTRRAKTAFKK